MGRSTTTKFAVQIFEKGSGRYTPACWNTKQAGRATDANLAKYVRKFEESTQPGGCNEHLGARTIIAAEIRTNDRDRRLVAEYFAPGVARNGGND